MSKFAPVYGCLVSDAQRKAAPIECVLCGNTPCGAHKMTWYRQDTTGAIYCGACVYSMLSDPQYADMRIRDALAAMGLQRIDPEH